MHGMAILPDDFFRGLLEGLEAGDENIGEEEETFRAAVLLVKEAEDSSSYKFTKKSTGIVDGLVVGLV